MYIYIDDIVTFILVGYFCTFAIWPIYARALFVGLVIICEIYYMLKINPRYRWIRFNSLGTCITIYILYIVIHLLIMSNEVNEFFIGAYQYLFYCSFIIISLFVSRNTNLSKFQKIVCFFGVIDVLLGIIEYNLQTPLFRNSENLGFLASGESYFRVSSFFTAPMIYGDWAGIFLLSSIGLFNTTKNKLYIFLSMFFLYGVYISYSRGTWIATICALIVYYSLYLKRGFRKRNTILFILVIVVCSGLYTIENNNLIEKFFLSICDFDNNKSNVGRMAAWLYSIDIFTSNIQNLLFGIGLSKTGAFSTATFVTESGVLKKLVEGGIVLASIYYMIIITLLCKLMKCIMKTSLVEYRNKFIYLLSVIVLILIHDITLQITEDCSISFMLWYALAWIIINSDNKACAKSSKYKI